MAGARVSISIDTEPLEERLRRLLEVAGDLRPVFRDMGEHLLNRMRERFAQQESPSGEPWAPLDPSYQARKRRNKGRILTLDGYLKGTLRYQVQPHRLMVGTDRIYGATHQFGREEAGIPARPFLGVSDSERYELENILLEHLTEALAG